MLRIVSDLKIPAKAGIKSQAGLKMVHSTGFGGKGSAGLYYLAME
jgi:hypothetical protein